MYEILKKAQPKVLKILENSYEMNRLSHAYLFCGPKGTYKKEMALHLAMMLYCGKEPCYKCENCHQILTGNHMNVIYIEPIGQSVKKEQIMALQAEFSKTSQVEGPRVFIIDDADTMSTEAANSLLKFIEEPTSEDTYGILMTQHEDNILPTIRSRSIVMNFNTAPAEVLKEELLESGVATEYVDVLAYLVNNKLEADKLLNDDNFNAVYETFTKFTSLLENEKYINLFFRQNRKVLYDRKNTQLFLNLIEGLYRDALELKISNKVLYFPSQILASTKICENSSIESIEDSIYKILEFENRLAYNVNVALAFDKLLLDLSGGEL